MSRKHRQQHEAKRAQLDHYHALDTEPAEGWDGIDDDDEAGDFDARGMAAWPAAQQGQQAHGAKG